MKNAARNIYDFRLQAENPKKLDLFIYSEVTKFGKFNWDTWEEEESTTSADYFAKKLAEYPEVEEINLYINSPGGTVGEGFAIGNQLKRHKAKVNCYIDGWACSVASVIAMSADVVKMYTNSLMMIHSAAMYIYGNAENLRKSADDLDKMTDAAVNSYCLKAGDKASREEIEELVKAETWLTAQRCFELGLCDEIIDEECNNDNAEMFNNKDFQMSAGLSEETAKKLFDLLKSKAAEKKPEEKNPQEADHTAFLNKYFNV